MQEGPKLLGPQVERRLTRVDTIILVLPKCQFALSASRFSPTVQEFTLGPSIGHTFSIYNLPYKQQGSILRYIRKGLQQFLRIMCTPFPRAVLSSVIRVD